LVTHSLTPTEKASVYVLHHEPGIRAGCIQCLVVIKQGTYTLGIKIAEERYLVGHNPPVRHCGEEKKVPLLFHSEEEAVKAAQETNEALNKAGNTSCLKLLEWAKFISTDVH